jgi:hypothetical protein
VGEAGYAELAAHPEALARLRDELRDDRDGDGRRGEARLDQFLAHLGAGPASAMLFHCTVCPTHLAYLDAP